MRIFKLMNTLMRKDIGFILLSVIAGLFTILSSIGLLSASSVLISRAALHPDVLDLMVLIVAVRFFGISRGVMRYLERIISHNVTFKILSSLRKWFYKQFNESYSENNKAFKTGDIYTKLVNDIDSLKEFYLRVLYPFVNAVLIGILTFIFLSYFSATLSFTYGIFYICSGFVLPMILFKLNKGLMKKESVLKKSMNLMLLDILDGSVELSVYSLKETLCESYHLLCKEFSKLQKEKNLITSLGDNAHSFSLSFLVTISLFQCAPLVSYNKLFGIYYALIPLAIMASFEALIPMPNILHKFNEALNAGKSIFSVIDYRSKDQNHHKEEVDSYDITVSNLKVLDDDSKGYIIEDISFKLPQGKKLAIVGVSGSGKTTILKALLGFIKYNSGTIKLGTNSYSVLDIEEIRKLFAYVEQSDYFFNTTLRENLLIADPEADTSAITSALEISQSLKLLRELPEGLDSLIGQNASKISGGEKQRLAIARVLLKNSPILLLDEPTASLDIHLEKNLIDSIHSSIKDKSCIWVTHRLVSMDKMDEILVIDKGKVCERGTHKELLDKKGFYYKLWRIQQQIYRYPSS